MTRLHRTALGGLSLVALGLGACSTQRPAPAPRPRPGSLAPSPARAPDPANFVAAAASIDLFVVRASDLALSQSSDFRVRALATRMRETHLGLARQLSFAGRRVNVLPAAWLLSREQRQLAALGEQRSFDDAFFDQLIAAHEQALTLHATFAARGSSRTLRPVAANAERVERAHLAELKAR